MKELEIDIETRSSMDLTKCGVYKYAESPDFQILLFAVSIDGEPVVVYDLACGELIPEEILTAIVDEGTIKWAHNASFERVCLSYWLRRNRPDLFRGYGLEGESTRNYLNPVSWRCTMILAAYNGLPLSLAQVGEVLKLDQQKMKEGRDLIRYFCTPSRNADRYWNQPANDPERWNLFKDYNRRDVETEMEIHHRLRNYPLPDFVWQEYAQDQEINDRGIMIDQELVTNAISMDAMSHEKLTSEMKEKTGLDNPNSVAQLKDYLNKNGIKTESLGKKDVATLMKTVPPDIRSVLSLRLQLAKSSVKKYQAMMSSVCEDGRCHGMFQFYGANRTGRWAGRLVQLQNLKQNHMPDLVQAREIIKTGDYDLAQMIYDPIPDTLSELVRTAFIPRPGYKLIVTDFSAIEARVLSYLAGEDWRTEVFQSGGDIYCASASQMFHVPVEKHGINGHLRQKGKIAELALGYGGSVGALTAMGALDMGLSEEELPELVDMWRDSNPNIVRYWWTIDRAVKRAIREHRSTAVGCLSIYCQSGILFIGLPSGRKLAYVKPQMGINQFSGESISYMGLNAAKKWSRIESYGPKVVENVVQGISRDLLANAMHTLRNCSIVAHVHDEVLIECRPEVSLKAICELMGRPPEWMPDICLRADGYECEFYLKD